MEPGHSSTARVSRRAHLRAYVLLATLLAGTFAFQSVLSLEALRHIWSEACCPAEIVNAVFHAADVFAAGALQHDDMTLIAL
jgi:vancomycin permeability regulator SanA